MLALWLQAVYHRRYFPIVVYSISDGRKLETYGGKNNGVTPKKPLRIILNSTRARADDRRVWPLLIRIYIRASRVRVHTGNVSMRFYAAREQFRRSLRIEHEYSGKHVIRVGAAAVQIINVPYFRPTDNARGTGLCEIFFFRTYYN